MDIVIKETKELYGNVIVLVNKPIIEFGYYAILSTLYNNSKIPAI
jgi:hypothetical protein